MDAMHIFIAVMAVVIAVLALLNPLHRDVDGSDVRKGAPAKDKATKPPADEPPGTA